MQTALQLLPLCLSSRTANPSASPVLYLTKRVDRMSCVFGGDPEGEAVLVISCQSAHRRSCGVHSADPATPVRAAGTAVLLHIFLRASAHTHFHTHTHTHTHTHARTHIHTRARARARTHIHSLIHSHTHTHAHTHIHMASSCPPCHFCGEVLCGDPLSGEFISSELTFLFPTVLAVIRE